MSRQSERCRILHLHSTFDAGGKELRCVRLMNAWGRDCAHAIVSGDPDKTGAASLINKAVPVEWPDFPSLRGKPLPRRLDALAAAMAGYDLVCSYNWGAMDAVMAHTLFGERHGLPPLVHHEDGFNEDESQRLKRSRNLYRRLALNRSAALVVPSRTLETIALDIWKQPRGRVRRIANGIPTRHFTHQPAPDALPGLTKQPGTLWVGTMAGLRKVKQLDVLIRAMRNMPEEWQLVIAGDGPEREALEAEAARHGLQTRVRFPGFVRDPARFVGLFDIFALSSASEQQPISVIEAMAAGKSVVSPRVGDVGSMVASANGPYLAAPGDDAALAEALVALARDPAARERVGEANCLKAQQDFDESGMLARYRALYWGLMGRLPAAAQA